MSAITAGSAQHAVVIKSMGKNLKIAENAKKDSKKVMKEASNFKNLREKHMAYSHLSRNVNGLQVLKQRILDDKAALSEAYTLKGGKKERIKDILKFCWGPKAKLNKELKELNHLQKAMERKMAKLEPQRFVEREKTIIDKSKVETKLIKMQVNNLKKKYKEGAKALKKFEAFGKASGDQMIKQYNAFTPKERAMLADFGSFRKLQSELAYGGGAVRPIMRALQKDIREGSPTFKKQLSNMRDEIKEQQKNIRHRQVKHFFGRKV